MQSSYFFPNFFDQRVRINNKTSAFVNEAGPMFRHFAFCIFFFSSFNGEESVCGRAQGNEEEIKVGKSAIKRT